MNTRWTSALPLVATCCLAAAVVRAQVPDGWYVTAHSTLPGMVPGLGGLWVHHPRTPGSAQQVQGLPNDLTGQGSTSWIQGAASVLWAGDGEPLYVGEFGALGTQIELHRVWLNGLNMTRADKVFLGVAGDPGQVTQIARHPDGGFLVTVDRIASGPLQGSALGLVTFGSTTTVQSLFARPAGDIVVHGVAVDGNRNIYVNVRDRLTNWSDIWLIPVVGQPRVLTRLTPAVGNLHVNARGELLAGYQGRIVFMDIVMNPGNVLRTCNVQSGVNAFALERVTDGFAIASGRGSAIPLAVFHARDCAPGTLLNATPATGWGIINGIDVVPSARPYGSPTRAISWAMPFPSGLPTVGNGTFALSANAQTILGLVFVYLSSGSGSLRLGGIELLLDPLVLVPVLPLTNSAHLPLPIPNDPTLQNMTVFLQAFGPSTQWPYGLVDSPGLRLTIL